MDETQGSVGSCGAFITTELRCKPAAHEDVCDVARPRSRPVAAGGGLDGAETCPPDIAGSETNFAPLMAGVLLFVKLLQARHKVSIESNGLGRVASSPG